MTTEQENTPLSRINRRAEKHLTTARFLLEHADLLASLDYDTMSEKFGLYDETPYVSYWTDSGGVTICVEGPEPRETMRILRKAIGGRWDKKTSSYSFAIEREWNGITIEIQGDRESVCQRVVTGTHERVIPAVEARPARTETVEEVEWVCGNLLDDGD